MDKVRHMNNPAARNLVMPSAGKPFTLTLAPLSVTRKHVTCTILHDTIYVQVYFILNNAHRATHDYVLCNTICMCPGLHIVLPGYYSPKTMGLLDPATSDGRVIFFLPWESESAISHHHRV